MYKNYLKSKGDKERASRLQGQVATCIVTFFSPSAKDNKLELYTLPPSFPPLPNTHNTNKLTNKKTVNNYDGFLRVSSILRHSERKIRPTLHRCKNIFTKCFKFPWQRLTTRNKWKPSLVCCSLLLLPPSYETIRIKYKVLFFLNFCSQAKQSSRGGKLQCLAFYSLFILRPI